MGSPSAPDDRGRAAATPSAIPLAGWKDVILRTWRETGQDNVGIVAAGVAFYGFLALIPLLGAIVLTYGLVAEPETVLRHATAITRLLPGETGQLIGQQLISVVDTSGGKKGFGLLLALVIALWGARNAAGSVVTALNIAYEEEETRSLVATTVLALLITVAAVVLALIAGGAIAMLAALEKLLPDVGPIGAALFQLLTFVLLGAAAAAAAATLFRYGPARNEAKWIWLTPGSMLYAIGWIVLTLGFGFYVKNFGNYGATYGSLSATVVMLSWLYLSSYLLLFAGELNSELEHQTGRDTTRGREVPLGQRGAWSADHVAGGDGPTEEASLRASLAEAVGAGKTVARGTPTRASNGHDYLVSRAASRAGPLVGARRISMASSALATVGLGLLKRRGRAKVGAALLAAAAGLAFLRRK
ncbi:MULTISPECIES: YihY/virulence factor BrkB family protein [Sphingomonas]|uniref:YihY/virulence factor BrkB family protein n=1 Tax=Sphingomonas TaxID=13687 RepID=UPI000DEFC887|nr:MULTISPECIES: YihY/virulence factor BrkB family protein [Sphingomonas]